MITCPLCGYQFDPAGLSCLANCPLAEVQGCQLICCPHCGYPIVDEGKSKLVTWLRRAWRSLPRPEVEREGRRL